MATASTRRSSRAGRRGKDGLVNIDINHRQPENVCWRTFNLEYEDGHKEKDVLPEIVSVEAGPSQIDFSVSGWPGGSEAVGGWGETKNKKREGGREPGLQSRPRREKNQKQ